MDEGYSRRFGMMKDIRVQLYYDNESAIEIARNPVQHDRTKQTEIKRHYMREKLDNNIVPSWDQTADILTKELPGPAFSN